MKKNKDLKMFGSLVLRVFVKYVVPALLGWLEGDSHIISDLFI